MLDVPAAWTPFWHRLLELGQCQPMQQQLHSKRRTMPCESELMSNSQL